MNSISSKSPTTAFKICVSAGSEAHELAGQLCERLQEAAGAGLELALSERRRFPDEAPGERADHVRHCDLLLLLAPTPDQVTPDVAWEVGYAAALGKPIVYLHSGPDRLGCFATYRTVCIESPELFEFLHALILNTEQFGARHPINKDVIDIIIRRLAVEIRELMPREQARATLTEVMAFGSRVMTEIFQPHRQLAHRWSTRYEREQGCRKLQAVVEDLESRSDEQCYLQPSRLERAFETAADRAALRRLFARWGELRAELFESLANCDVAAVSLRLSQWEIIHGEFLARSGNRFAELGDSPPEIAMRAAAA